MLDDHIVVDTGQHRTPHQRHSATNINNLKIIITNNITHTKLVDICQLQNSFTEKSVYLYS